VIQNLVILIQYWSVTGVCHTPLLTDTQRQHIPRSKKSTKVCILCEINVNLQKTSMQCTCYCLTGCLCDCSEL